MKETVVYAPISEQRIENTIMLTLLIRLTEALNLWCFRHV